MGVSEGAHGLAVRCRRMVSGLVELGRPVRHAQRAPLFFSAGVPCTAAERRQVSFGTRCLQSSIDGLYVGLLAKACRKYAHQWFFSADAPCTGSGAPPGFIGFFPEVSRH